MSRPTNPTLFLSVTGPDGVPLSAPAFCAIDVTAALVRRLRRLNRLCDGERLAWLATRDVEPAPFWDASEELMTEQLTTWFACGTCLYVELTARRRVRGGYGRLEVIGQTPAFDLAELEHLRGQRILLDFRDDGHDETSSEPFALLVMSRLGALAAQPPRPREKG